MAQSANAHSALLATTLRGMYPQGGYHTSSLPPSSVQTTTKSTVVSNSPSLFRPSPFAAPGRTIYTAHCPPVSTTTTAVTTHSEKKSSAEAVATLNIKGSPSTWSPKAGGLGQGESGVMDDKVKKASDSTKLLQEMHEKETQTSARRDIWMRLERRMRRDRDELILRGELIAIPQANGKTIYELTSRWSPDSQLLLPWDVRLPVEKVRENMHVDEEADKMFEMYIDLER